MFIAGLLTAALAASPVPAKAPPSPTPGHPVALPTVFLENRFAVAPKLEDGTKLVFYTDSGGGRNLLDQAVAKRLHLPAGTFTAEGQTLPTTPWPRFSSQAFIPAPLDAKEPLLAFPHEQFEGMEGDGFLGQPWFDGRTWTFDYPGKTLWWRANGDLPKVAAAHRIPLHFKTDPKTGKREFAFARMEIEVDGQKLPMLFDTGATLRLTPEAVKALGGGPARRGGAFITRRVFERWQKAHPTWRVIQHADGKAPIIEVPRVKVAGYTVGPVWFAMRANKNFDEMMSSMMDAHVEGAFGGGGMKTFRVTVDYAQGVAVFEKP